MRLLADSLTLVPQHQPRQPGPAPPWGAPVLLVCECAPEKPWASLSGESSEVQRPSPGVEGVPGEIWVSMVCVYVYLEGYVWMVCMWMVCLYHGRLWYIYLMCMYPWSVQYIYVCVWSVSVGVCIVSVVSGVSVCIMYMACACVLCMCVCIHTQLW